MARLLFFIQHRLVQLQWTRNTLAEAGGPSPSTLRKAHREDRELAERTLARLDRARAGAARSASTRVACRAHGSAPGYPPPRS